MFPSDYSQAVHLDCLELVGFIGLVGIDWSWQDWLELVGAGWIGWSWLELVRTGWNWLELGGVSQKQKSVHLIR